MSKVKFLIVMGVLLFCYGSAGASITDFSCYFPNDPYEYDHSWDYDFVSSELTLNERFLSLPPLEGDQVVMRGETDSTTTFTVVKTITNTTGITWTGYDLELLSSGTFVGGTAGSTKFGTYSFSDDFRILHFYAPLPVLDTQMVTLQFDINIPTNGVFEFTMAQHPIPEPASIILLGLGVAFLRKRK